MGIYKIFEAVMNDQKEKYTKILDSLKIKLTTEEKDLSQKPLLKVVMRKFLPLPRLFLT